MDSHENDIVLGSHEAIIIEDRIGETTTTTSVRVGGTTNRFEKLLISKDLLSRAYSQSRQAVTFGKNVLAEIETRSTRSSFTLENGDSKGAIKPAYFAAKALTGVAFSPSDSTALTNSNAPTIGTESNENVPSGEPTKDASAGASPSNSASPTPTYSDAPTTSTSLTNSNAPTIGTESNENVPSGEPTKDASAGASPSNSASPTPTYSDVPTTSTSPTNSISPTDSTSTTNGTDGSDVKSSSSFYNLLFSTLLFIIIIVCLVKKCIVTPSTDERYTRVPQGDMGDVSKQHSVYSCFMMMAMTEIDHDYFIISLHTFLSQTFQRCFQIGDNAFFSLQNLRIT